MSNFKSYHGRVPACGVFCGGCPTYTRERKPCPGADINIKRCEGCTTFHLCCKEKGITHCYECGDFPCRRFKSFSKRWLKNCLLYTSDAADDLLCVDLGGRRIIKKKK